MADLFAELQEAARALYIADLDYEDFKGGRLADEYAERARRAQARYRAAKAAYECTTESGE